MSSDILEILQDKIRGRDFDVLVILGPTAIGKTGLSIDLANKINAEIISADSRMVYKTMDIGTSKPNHEEMKGVPHYLVDLVEPDKDFNVSTYQKLAFEKIDDILDRGKVPMMVGGTMLYIDAVLGNYKFAECEPDDDIRENLDKMSTEELFNRLRKVDSDAANSISPNNRAHIIRPLEVIEKTGKKYSEYSKKGNPRYKFLKIGLIQNRETLYNKINQRVEDQLDMGLLEETKKLADKYPYSLPSMTGLGYKQMGYFLRNEMSFDEAKEILKRDTRHFAKRQITWWKRDDEIEWIDIN